MVSLHLTGQAYKRPAVRIERLAGDIEGLILFDEASVGSTAGGAA